MDKNAVIKLEGIVEEALPGLLFRVKVRPHGPGSEKDVLAHPAGKMKLNRIRVIPGDRVIVEMPDINDKRGRIVRRL